MRRFFLKIIRGHILKNAEIAVRIICLVAILLIPAIACDSGAKISESSTISITDQFGRTINLNGTPNRIISLAPSNTEILFALGLEDKIVGVTEYCNYPPEAQNITKIGGFSTVDMEKIIELNPDLILAANIHKDTEVPELERRGFNIIIVAPETLDDVMTNILLVSTATGTEKEAKTLVNSLEKRVRAVTDKVASLTEEERLRVFYITWHDPLWTVGKDTITNELIETAGGKNIVDDMSGHGQIDLETLIWRNPQIILASTGHGSAGNSTFTWAKTEDRLDYTDARQNGTIYQVDADLITRPGPRIIDGLELIASLIHPELFSD